MGLGGQLKDLIDRVAFPVPIAVICHLLGVPDTDRARFRDWGHRLADTLEPDGVGAEEMRTRSAELALTSYLRDLVAQHRAAPDASLLSALVAAEETTVRRGQSVIVAIGGANRDPEVSDRPDVLDVGRADAGRHLSFSFGMHHCLGAALARLEARVVFEELSRRWPDLEAVGPPAGRPRMVLRGWDHIAVRAA